VVEAYAPGIMSSQENKCLNSPQSLAIRIPINLPILGVIDR
jgi:hypothetical protein